MTTNTTRAYVDVSLLKKTRKMFPETKGLTYSGLVDFLIRKALEERSVMPKCLSCKAELPREIKATGIHHESCPWNYYVQCKCGYQNNVSKLLGFWAGCSKKCREA